MVKGQKDVVKHPGYVDRDRDNTEGDDQKIPAHLGESEGFLFVFSEKKEKVGVEVDTKKDHKDCDDPLLEEGVARHAVRQDAEASGTRSAEAEAEGIKEGHARQKKQDDLGDSHSEINQVKDLCRVADLGHELADYRAGALRPHHVDLVSHPASAGRHDGEYEYNDTHAPDPVGEASPEQAGMAQGFDVGQNTGTGRCETGNCLKQGIRVTGNISAEYKGKCSADTDHDPYQRDADKSLLCVKLRVRFAPEIDQEADQIVSYCHAQINQALSFAIDQSGERRKQKEDRLELHNQPGRFPNNGIIHNYCTSCQDNLYSAAAVLERCGCYRCYRSCRSHKGPMKPVTHDPGHTKAR